MNEAFTAGVSLPGLPDRIEKIIVDSVITHGREGGFECTVYRKDKEKIEMGVFITFKSVGKNVITRVNVFKKEPEV
ncbi:hypothetical protein [Salinicoccus sp. HZC-1]|uniref:hypothetical protein n=1 Tax=Salinicoccus sp. HZC-1 TaxID=3385497 RepID=UPI00398B06E5